MDENRFIVLLTDTQDIKVMECDPQEDIFDIAKRVIDCDWIQDVYPAALGDDYLLLVDDEGKYREGTLTINSVASDLIGPDRYNDPIIGNAVIVKEKDESLTLLTRGEAVGIANMLTLKRDLTPNEIANAYRAQQSALHTNNPARDKMYAKRFKKFYQVSTYLPHFISTVVMCGMIILFLSPSSGVLPKLASLVGIQMGDLMGNAKAFSSIYVWTEVWQHVGWDSIMYIAALSAVDPQLYEAAVVDGANKWQKMIYIDIPMLATTAITLFILRTGSLLGVGFEKVFLLQNDLNIASSEIISTYVYKMGLRSNQYSYSAAIGLFNNVVNFVLLLSVNFIAKRVGDTSLF